WQGRWRVSRTVTGIRGNKHPSADCALTNLLARCYSTANPSFGLGAATPSIDQVPLMRRLTFPNNVRSVRGINRSEVLRCIEQWPGISRKEITQKIGLTDAAVSRISRELVDYGLVGEEPDPGAEGR